MKAIACDDDVLASAQHCSERYARSDLKSDRYQVLDLPSIGTEPAVEDHAWDALVRALELARTEKQPGLLNPALAILVNVRGFETHNDGAVAPKINGSQATVVQLNRMRQRRVHVA